MFLWTLICSRLHWQMGSLLCLRFNCADKSLSDYDPCYTQVDLWWLMFAPNVLLLCHIFFCRFSDVNLHLDNLLYGMTATRMLKHWTYFVLILEIERKDGPIKSLGKCNQNACSRILKGMGPIIMNYNHGYTG